ncbi:MAG: DNA-binding response regulator [Deltaproteobacteria bacterium HGW-Deltaproteobacteria-15]|jgi:DNA-binding response OmpR family regulator|nr:MAG: DNA-binding response regulator [Deltaproteobacteria bacterium HGW-Deltaproteobacteria-15]
MNRPEERRILIIEDEIHIAEGLKLNLGLKGHVVRIAMDGVAGLREWKEWQPDLIVLDVMLPSIDGFSVLRNIRLEDERVPILILSAKGDAEDKVKGFSCGVDDYLSKPFHLEEFLMRVERLLIRTGRQGGAGETAGNSSQPGVYTFGGNRIDFETLSAYGQCGTIRLTGQEAKLLKHLVANRGKPVSRKRLLEICWGYGRGTQTRTIDNFIVRFRRYFEKDPRKPAYFKSLRSVGYVFEDPTAETVAGREED